MYIDIMKRLLLILFLFLSLMPVEAKNVKVQAMSDFSTQNPPQTWKLKIVEGFSTKDGYMIYTGSVIEGKIEGVTDPKRLKRNATFEFVPVNYYNSYDGKTYKIQRDMVGKYSSLTDVTAGSVIKTGAVAAGSHFISGFIGPSVALVEGVVKNEEGNRAKSAAVSVYESTPLSYASKGKELEIKEGQVFVMNFKLLGEDEDKPNYEYTLD